MEALPSEPPDDISEIRVGIREMRHDFRAWMDRVRNGQRIVITDRGEPIVDLVPHDPTRTWLDFMYEQGHVAIASGELRIGWSDDDPITTSASDALQEQREDRT